MKTFKHKLTLGMGGYCTHQFDLLIIKGVYIKECKTALIISNEINYI
jgi:hypothetical protein